MIRKIGQAGTERIIREPAEADPAAAVIPIDALFEAIDGLPDTAQYLLFTSVEQRFYVYWGEGESGPWTNLETSLPD